MKKNTSYKLISSLISIFCKLENQTEDYQQIDEVLPLIETLGIFLSSYEKNNDQGAKDDLHYAFEMVKDPNLSISANYDHAAEELPLTAFIEFITDYWNDLKSCYKTYSIIIDCLLLADLPDDETLIVDNFIHAALTELKGSSDNSPICSSLCNVSGTHRAL